MTDDDAVIEEIPMDYMISTRNKKKSRFGSEPGPARYLKVPGQSDTPLPEHIIKRKSWVKAVLSDSKPGANPEDHAPTGDILIFIHGYNNSPEKVLAQQRLLRKSLEGLGFA